MFKNKPRLICLMLALAMIFALASCATDETTEAPVDETTTTQAPADDTDTPTETDPTLDFAKIQIVYYGDQSPRMADFAENELKDKLKKDINAELELTYLPWSEYGGGRVDLMLASGEDFSTYTDVAHLARIIPRGFVQDLTDIADKYCTDLKKNVDPLSFTAFSFDGKLYAIPVGDKPNAGVFFSSIVRQDLLEEVGMSEITSVEDLEDFFDKCIELYPDYYGIPQGINRSNLAHAISTKNIEWLGNFAFVDASVKDDKVYSWFESEEYKNLATIAHRWNQKGITPAEPMSGADQRAIWNAGRGMWGIGGPDARVSALQSITEAVPTARTKNYWLSDLPPVSRGTYSTAYLVSVEAKDPARYAMFFNLIQGNQDDYDFFAYGVKDKDWTLVDGDRIELINTDNLFDDWMVLNRHFVRFPTIWPDDYIDEWLHWDDGSIPGKTIGFVFDTEPVASEAARLEGVYSEFFEPITQGFVSYDEGFADAHAKLKDAGIDKYMAELQKQFSDFYANNAN